MSSEDSRRDLADALLQVTEQQRQSAADARRPRPEPPSGTPLRTVLVATLAAAVLAWLWIAQPAAVFAPNQPPPLGPAEAEARARLALYLERVRIEDYRRSTGRLPAALADAGAVEAGVTYRQVEGGFVLESNAGPAPLQLTNRMNSDSFLGNAVSPGGPRGP